MSDIRGCLSGLATGNDGVRANKAERIDYDFSFDRLDRVDDDCHRPRVQRFE